MRRRLRSQFSSHETRERTDETNDEEKEYSWTKWTIVSLEFFSTNTLHVTINPSIWFSMVGNWGHLTIAAGDGDTALSFLNSLWSKTNDCSMFCSSVWLKRKWTSKDESRDLFRVGTKMKISRNSIENRDITSILTDTRALKHIDWIIPCEHFFINKSLMQSTRTRKNQTNDGDHLTTSPWSFITNANFNVIDMIEGK